jgi:adenylosuccinate synthase
VCHLWFFQKLNHFFGVAKAYTTRVGAGPFPTELLDEDGEIIRSVGAEFGTTTGRPRRCGWLDTELLRFAVAINGITSLALTKLDVLDSFSTIKLCVGYTIQGKSVSYTDGDARFLSSVKPVYKTMKGWNMSLRDIRSFSDLPPEARAYIAEIETLVGVPVSILSVGARRDQTIIKNVL